MMDSNDRPGWARAKFLLEQAFETCSSPVADVEIGRVKKVGEGVFRKVYVAHVDLSPDPDPLSGAWAVLLPDRQATPEDCWRWIREVTVLGQLTHEQLPFRVPAPLGAFPDGDRRRNTRHRRHRVAAAPCRRRPAASSAFSMPMPRRAVIRSSAPRSTSTNCASPHGGIGRRRRGVVPSRRNRRWPS